MSVDTRNKRMSLIGIGSPVPSVLPNPDGTIGATDRAHLLWLYAGIVLLYPAVEALTLHADSLSLTLYDDILASTLNTDSLDLTIYDDILDFTLKDDSLDLTLWEKAG